MTTIPVSVLAALQTDLSNPNATDEQKATFLDYIGGSSTDFSNVTDEEFLAKGEASGLMAATGENAAMTDDQKTTFRQYIGAAASSGGGSGMLLYGDGPPDDDDVGADGDTWRDQTAGKDYGPKANGTWAGAGSYTFASHSGPSYPFPDGALFALDINSYDTAYAVIPNILGANPINQIYNRAPSGAFDNTLLFGNSGVVVTPNSDGSADLALSSGGLTGLSSPLAAGTYTIGITAKRIGGSDQLFDMGALGIDNEQHTATSVYQEFKHTFTLGAPASQQVWFAGCVTTGAGANITVKNARLVAGSADVVPYARQNDVYMGSSARDPVNTGIYSAGTLNLGNDPGAWGISQSVTAIDMSQFTISCVAAKLYASTTGTVARGDYQPFLATGDNNNADYNDFSIFWEEPHGSVNVLYDNPGGMLQHPWELFTGAAPILLGDGYHSYTWRYNQDYVDLWVDGLYYNTFQVGAFTGPQVKNLLLNMILAPNLTASYGYAGQIRLWDAALSDAQCRQIFLAQKAISVPVLTSPAYTWAADGDSITGSFTYSYPYNAVAALSPKTYLAKRANTSLFLPNLVTRLPKLLALIPPSKSGRKFIYSVLIGANDADNIIADPTGWAADLADYLDSVKAGGFDKVIVGTILPRTNTGSPGLWPAFDTPRATVNTLIRSWVGTHCDGVMDFAADSTIGGDAACNNGALYPDGLHPSSSAQGTYMVPIATAAVQAFVV